MTIAARLDLLVQVGVDRPTDCHIADMSGKEPCDHEGTKRSVTGHPILKVAENLGQREEKIDHIHQAKNHIPNSGHAIAITAQDQGAGDEMVNKHLHVVFPPLLNIDDDKLLQPEGKNHEVIIFGIPIDIWKRRVGPKST